MSETPPYTGNLLRWPIDRRGRSFRVYVVEPLRYYPTAKLDALLLDVLIGLANPIIEEVQAIGITQTHFPLPFDLVTFPEAFLSPSGLLSALKVVKERGLHGCVHVGLRSASTTTHLTRTDEVQQLVDSLMSIDGLVVEDLSAFITWLAQQSPGHYFNIGCIFAFDCKQRVRICLHPKMVRARVELSVTSESTMEPGTLLTAVVLEPINKAHPTVAIQPLLCSDVLALDVDNPMQRPLVLMNTYPGVLGDRVPDQIDLISVPTCTPVQAVESPKGPPLHWHQQFVSEFVRVQMESPRHHPSVFVLSNFTEFPHQKGPRPGGLSGLFVPQARESGDMLPNYLAPFSYRSTAKHLGFWKYEADMTDREKETTLERGFVASLDAGVFNSMSEAHVLGFTVYRMVRDSTGWFTDNPLSSIELYAVDDKGSMKRAGVKS